MQAHKGSGNVAPTYQQPDPKRSWVISVRLRPDYLREGPCTHCTGGWVALEAGLENTENLTHNRTRSPDRRIHMESI
jgi:hypothetical protein